jgi:uncharacterized protein (TIGR02001 family)
MKTLNKTLIAAALLTSAGVAQAEVSANVGVASAYLWRGFDLGYGSAVVSGGLDYAEGPFYAGVWASSGDDAYGTEYDLYAGLAGEAGDFSYDVGYVTYNYPDTLGAADFEEVYLSLGYGDFSVSAYDNNDADYTYYALGAGFGDFSFTYGMWSGSMEGSHIDATYSMGDFGFTLSQVIDEDTAYTDDELKMMVSYSIPLEM